MPRIARCDMFSNQRDIASLGSSAIYYKSLAKGTFSPEGHIASKIYRTRSVYRRSPRDLYRRAPYGCSRRKFFRRQGRKVGAGANVLAYVKVAPAAFSAAYGRILRLSAWARLRRISRSVNRQNIRSAVGVGHEFYAVYAGHTRRTLIAHHGMDMVN